MPATVSVRIYGAKHLPIMDRSGETTDAFVEVRLADHMHKTDVCRRSLNPQWNSEWFKFEVNDEELQEEPLQIRVMDYDTYSSHDAIGRIYIDLTNMLIKENRSTLCGWLPIYDTLLGIRGQLQLEVRLHPFCVDMKSLWHSSSVLFFAASLFPSGYRVRRLIGLVDHSLVAEDPEHQWIDKIRTPRTTNEARQLLFMKMSGELKRRLANKVVEIGGNAVLAFTQRMDLGHIGVILRAIGTAAVVEKITANESSDPHSLTVPIKKPQRLETVLASPETGGTITIRVEESQPDGLSANEDVKAERVAVFQFDEVASSNGQPELVYQSSQAEFPFFTLKHVPSGIVRHIGGMVSCRMTRTIERLDQDDPSETPYLVWWKEIRQEIFRHMKCIGCNAVLGYTEELRLTDDGNIQLMNAAGTAVVLDIQLQTRDRDHDMMDTLGPSFSGDNVPFESGVGKYPECVGVTPDCRLFHYPPGDFHDHVSSTAATCVMCKNALVPDMLLSTTEPIEGAPIKGIGTLVQARVIRSTKPMKGEPGCRELSEALPFIEYQLHSQISTKLKLLGLNAVFGLQIDVQCGSEVIVGCATGTGYFISCLPRPARPVVSDGTPGTDRDEAQAKVDALFEQSVRMLGLVEEKDDAKQSKNAKATRPNPRKKRTTGIRQYSKAFLLDLEDSRIEGRDITTLIDFAPPKDMLLVGTEVCAMQDRLRQSRHNDHVLAGRQFAPPFQQNFCRVWRTKVSNEQDESADIGPPCARLIKDIMFRARMYRPCRIAGIEFEVQVTPDDELVIIAQGTILPEPVQLVNAPRNNDLIKKIRTVSSKLAMSGSDDNTDPSTTPKFRIDDHSGLFLGSTGDLPLIETAAMRHNRSAAFKIIRPSLPSSPQMNRNPLLQDSVGFTQGHVTISSLSFVHSGIVKRYVGALNLVILRECQSLKEIDGLSGFMQRALADFYAIVRGQTLASGGNTVLTFRIAQLQIADSYNQAQCIIHGTGDMLFVEPNDLSLSLHNDS